MGKKDYPDGQLKVRKGFLNDSLEENFEWQQNHPVYLATTILGHKTSRTVSAFYETRESKSRQLGKVLILFPSLLQSG